jgi:hypothetical protein
MATSNPRLSANKVGEYLGPGVGPARRRRIIYDAKFPSDAIRPYYQSASEAIAQFIAGGMTDLGVLEKQASILGEMNPETVWQSRRINGNIEALEAFAGMLDAIDLRGAKPSLGAHKASPLAYNGVAISVRPEVLLETSGARPTVGGIKIHFPKANPHSAQSAGYVSAMTHEFCKQHLASKGAADPRLCLVIDVASAKFYSGPTSTKARMKDVAAACAEVASLWPTIQP